MSGGSSAGWSASATTIAAGCSANAAIPAPDRADLTRRVLGIDNDPERHSGERRPHERVVVAKHGDDLVDAVREQSRCDPPDHGLAADVH
jgi:hypothetical protein